jgi:hypothetical protein
MKFDDKFMEFYEISLDMIFPKSYSCGVTTYFAKFIIGVL